MKKGIGTSAIFCLGILFLIAGCLKHLKDFFWVRDHDGQTAIQLKEPIAESTVYTKPVADKNLIKLKAFDLRGRSSHSVLIINK